MSEARVIPNWSGYRVTTNGRVWSHHSKRWLESSKSKIGYSQVNLHKHGKHFNNLVHRLVLETFVGPCPKGMECRHLDGNPANNQLNNLKWGTRSENMRDRVRHGTSSRGEQSGNAKLTESIVILIRQLWNIRWMGVKQWELAEMFNISQGHVTNIVNRRRWKHI